jgi:hypothetical protein
MPKYIESIEIESIDSILWSSVCRRLIHSYPVFSETERFAPFQFLYRGSDLEGIIHALTKRCGGNVHEKGSVNISCSSSATGTPIDLANLTKPCNSWYTGNNANSWIQFDFKDQAVCVNSYTLNSGGTGYYIQHWVIEVSNDGSSWVAIDSRSGSSLGSTNVTKHFECTSPPKEFSRYIRLRQTSTNANGYHFLALGNIEFFGQLRNNAKANSTSS